MREYSHDTQKDAENNLYIVGSTDDIKATYKAICRHNTWDCWATRIEPKFLEFPTFSDNKLVYALCIDENYEMTVINSDTLLSLIIDGVIIDGLKTVVAEKLKGVSSLELYVTGLTVALVEVINYCHENRVKLTLMHYNRDTNGYYAQKVSSEETH